MKRNIFLFSIIFLSIFLFTSIYIQSNSLLVDEKPNREECPYLQNLNEEFCPYLKEKAENQNSEYPYLRGEIKCPYTGEDSNSKGCPFLQNEKDGNKVYPIIKNTSI